MKKPLQIIHLTAHTGGGVGAVLQALIQESLIDGELIPSIVTLEQANEATRTWARTHEIALYENAGELHGDLMERLASADIVHIHWWNHPLMEKLLFCTDLPPLRSVLWSHVNGHAIPQAFFPELVALPNLFVVATPYSLESETIRSLSESECQARIRYVHSSAGIPDFAPPSSVKAGSCSFAYIGTVDYCKMHRDILSIWRNAAIPEATLHIYGGSGHEAIREQVQISGNSTVHVHGPVSPIGAVFQALHVLVYPLQADHYGTGEQVLIEAMACGVVPVVFNNACEQHIVQNGITGICVSSSEEFSIALRELANNPAKRKIMAQNAWTFAHAQYSKKSLQQQWRSIYTECLELPRKKIVQCIPMQNDWAAKLLQLVHQGTEQGCQALAYLNGESLFVPNLSEAFYAQTRGTPHHFHQYFPFSEIIDMMSLKLENSSAMASLAPCLSIPLARCCPVCGHFYADAALALNYALFDDLEIAGKCDLVRCRQCGMIFIDSCLSERELEHYYRTNEYYATSHSGGSGGSTTQDLWRYRCVFEKVLTHLPNPAPIVLDFGCGKGGFSQWLKQQGIPSIYGVEQSESCRQVAEQNLACIAVDSLEALPVEKVDLVILSHVLEHLLAPRTLLEKLHRYCHRGTIIYCEVPNCESYLKSSSAMEKLYFEHVSHFSAQSLSHILNQNGYRILEGGVKPFSEYDDSNSCLYVIAQLGEFTPQSIAPYRHISLPVIPVSMEAQVNRILATPGTIALWGISQYCMLLLGLFPLLLERIQFLYDSSPAKIGRYIQGKEIRASHECLQNLATTACIVIPRSPYFEEIQTEITQRSPHICIFDI